ncbi:MAG TPA: adenosylmethionine--8-amino-7-oxononanoate transaminase [Acidiferrobacteraceae bacterium]|nr:adenosylmethionine--8-amino-7-oxononanoate transaminase [Acidiferrobacteraceae bacterium]HEX19809.1 adenosylmethionine--8-amino-7-oxononanoate transaminase [Acidiferrobacteraceae bacterium]
MNKDIDQQHIWHPYSAMHSELPIYEVVSADGVRLTLSDGRELIDGMASWWCMIHGYNHPQMNTALERQLNKMAHVMFGGLTHEPAMTLTRQLLDITPEPLQKIFFSDSGSVSVEVAMKMAMQYWQAKGQPQRHRFIALRSGYHGDTLGAMSVCDPVTGMHSLFQDILPRQVFVDQPRCRFGEPCTNEDIAPLEDALKTNQDIAALIMEPIVQGAGGMWFYSADYLKKARALCGQYDVLLILDEIATGFGRTGKLFACEHAGISPDIMCIGKALTGGYMTLAATLTTETIASTIDQGDPGVFMHGPTFMANPLACTAASSSIRLLLESDWQNNIRRIQQGLEQGLAPCRAFDQVEEVRVLGAIGVVEMKQAVDMKGITGAFVDAGVWVRPFGKLVYLMPPYIIGNDDLQTLTDAVVETVQTQK